MLRRKSRRSHHPSSPRRSVASSQRSSYLAEPLEHRTLLAATIGLNFTGITFADSGFIPPDTIGAVGLNHIAEFTNGAFAIYNKSNGAQVGSIISDTTFWTSKVGLSFTGGLTDPRILFDHATQRWIATEITKTSTANKVLLGRSDTSDPTGTWKGTSFTGNSGFADFDTLGLDADGVYVGTNNFTSSTGTFTGVSLFSIPKVDLLAGNPTLANMTSFENLSASIRGSSIQPAVNFESSDGHGALVSRDAISFSFLDRTNVNNPGSPGASLSATSYIPIAITSDPPDARQPDGTQDLDTGNTRFSGNVYEVGDLLYMARAIGASGRAAVRWTILNEATNVVIQEGTISDPNYDFFYPSIAANTFGEVVIGYNRSGTGPSDFVSSFTSVGTTSGGLLAFDPPMLLKAGEANYHRTGTGTENRWGDYSATVVDPSNPHVFWTFQEYPKPGNVWATQITQLVIPQVPYVPTGGEFRVNTTTADFQTDVSVAANSSGNFVVAWASGEQDGSGLGIYAQRYDRSGGALGGEFLVNTTTAGDQDLADITMDAAGNFVVVWQGPDASGLGVFGQRFTANGIKQGSEFAINTFPSSDQYLPRIAMDSSGNFTVVWQSSGQDGSGFGVYARRYNSSGVAAGPEFQVNVTTANDQRAPSISSGSSGGFVVTWGSAAGPGGAAVFARRYDGTGVPLTGEVQVNTYPYTYIAGDQDGPAIASDAAGNYVVTWSSTDQVVSGRSVHAQRFSANGVPNGSEFWVNPGSPAPQTYLYPSVAMASDGRFVVSWSTGSFGVAPSQDGSDGGAYAQRYNADGSPDGAEFRLNTYTPNNQLRSRLANQGNGAFVATWQSEGQDPAWGVYAQRFMPGTIAWDGGAGTTNWSDPANWSTDSVPTATDDVVISIPFAPVIHVNTPQSVHSIYCDTLLDISSTLSLAASSYIEDLAILSGTLIMAAGGDKVLSTRALLVDDGGRLDLNDNAMIVDYTPPKPNPLETIKADLTSGYAGGAWNGAGINSSVAASTPNRALGYAESSAIFSTFPAMFAGQQVDNTTVLVRYTRYGDSDLNQTVNLNDFNRLAANFGGSNTVWSQGNFNFDNITSLADFNLLAANFGQVASPAMRGTLSPPIGQSIFNDDRDDELI